MVSHSPGQSTFTPSQIILQAFKSLKVPADGAVGREALINALLEANCPRREDAEKILARMTEWGILEKRTICNGTIECYARTQAGIRQTP
jgi:hypothetical protein